MAAKPAEMDTESASSPPSLQCTPDFSPADHDIAYPRHPRYPVGADHCVHPPRTGMMALRGAETQEWPMSRVSTYLNFPGTTEEAFTFYASVFGTGFSVPINRFGDMPSAPGLASAG